MKKKAGRKKAAPRNRNTRTERPTPAPEIQNPGGLTARDLMPDPGAPSGDSADELAAVEAEAQRLEEAERRRVEKEVDSEVHRQFPRGSARRQTVVRRGMVGSEAGERSGANGAKPGHVDAIEAYPDLIREIRSPLLPLDVREGERIFHSKYERHVVQVTTPAPEYDPLHGKRIDRPGHTILFSPRPEIGVGEFRTTNEKDILFLEGGEYKDENGKVWDIPPAMGYGTTIWDAVAKRKAEARIYVRNLKEQLAASPEVVDVLRQELPTQEFSVFEMLAEQVRKSGLGEDFS